MKLRDDGLETRAAFLGGRFVPFDEIVEVDQRVARLACGSRLNLPMSCAEPLKRIVDGPTVTGVPKKDAAAWSDYLRGPWSATRAVRSLLELATRAQASDIHVETDPSALRIRFRIAGELESFAELERKTGDRLVAAMKHLSGCLPYRRDIAQEGRISRDGAAADVRASFVPTPLGERVALRLFGRLLTVEQLGLAAEQLGELKDMLAAPSGLVLVAGSSGAGKTTTLYAALTWLTQQRRTAHLSLEDPVEQRLRMAGIPVDQIELCPERGLTGEAALVAALRQDVDVIAVGEVRTEAEALLAVKAAHTGRLVLAGVHAGSAREAALRMKELGADAAVLDATLVGAIHQRLVTAPCVPCERCHERGRIRKLSAALWRPAAGVVREVA